VAQRVLARCAGCGHGVLLLHGRSGRRGLRDRRVRLRRSRVPRRGPGGDCSVSRRGCVGSRRRTDRRLMRRRCGSSRNRWCCRNVLRCRRSGWGRRRSMRRRLHRHSPRRLCRPAVPGIGHGAGRDRSRRLGWSRGASVHGAASMLLPAVPVVACLARRAGNGRHDGGVAVGAARVSHGQSPRLKPTHHPADRSSSWE
jgi:hypothetical protein